MKRLNVKLLVWLTVVSVLLGVGIYVLNWFQVARNASFLLSKGKKDIANKQYLEGLAALQKYLHYNPEDKDATKIFALTCADLAETPDATNHDKLRAFTAMENTLRKYGDMRDVRKRLAEYSLNVLHRLEPAIAQYKELLKEPGDDASELRLKLGVCYEVQEEIDEAKKIYEELIKDYPKDTTGYIRLATLTRYKLQEAEAADKIMDQMVEANPDNFQAYFARAEYFAQVQMRDAAAPDMVRALELAPDNLEVLLFAARFVLAGNEIDEARKHLLHAEEKHPDDVTTQLLLANLDLLQQKPDEALARMERTSKKHPEEVAVLQAIIDFRIAKNDLPAARDTFERLRKVDSKNPEFKDFLEFSLARLLLAERKFDEAVTKLERLRLQPFAQPASRAVQIDSLLATCYGALGQSDMQLQCLSRAVQRDPTAVQVRKSRAVLLMSLGRDEEAREEWVALQGVLPEARAILVKMEMDRQKALPADQQNLAEVDKLLNEWQKLDKSNTPTVALLKAELLVSENKFDEARAEAQKILEQYPESPAPWVFLASLATKTEGGYPEALRVLDQGIAKLPDAIDLQVVRLDVIARLAPDQGLPLIEQAAKDAEKIPEAVQLTYLQKVGATFYRLGVRDRARDMWNIILARQPKDANIHLAIFALSQESQDEEGMQASLDRMKPTLGEDSPTYLYCLAAREAVRFRAKKGGAELIANARKYLGQVLEQRDKWALAYSLSGDLDALEKNIDGAIENYQRAVEYGDRSPLVIQRLVQMLTREGRWDEARQRLGQLQESGADLGSLGKLELLIGQQTGTLDVAQAAKVLGDSEDPQDLVWLGQLYEREKNYEKAEETIRKAISLNDANGTSWVALVGFLMGRTRVEEAEQTIDQMRGKVPEKELQLMLAQAYELLTKKDKAEEAYQAAIAEQPDSFDVKRTVANFFLRQGRTAEARKLLEEILAKASSVPESDKAIITWGRRQLARVMAVAGDYHQLMDAVKLVDANAVAGELSMEDSLLKALLLGQAPDRKSRDEAIAIFESFSGDDLRPESRFQLARLYEQGDRWEQAKEQTLLLLAQQPNNITYQNWFIRMLLKHRELDESAARIDKLKQQDANSLTTIELAARLAIGRGNVEEGISLLRAAIPRPLPPQQRELLSRVGDLLVEVAPQTDVANQQVVYRAAEQFYRDFIAEMPESALVLANFLGRFGNLQEAFEICSKEMSGPNAAAAVQVAMQGLRSQPSNATAEQFEQASRWIGQLASSIGPARENLLRAELADFQGKIDESAELYRKVLTVPDLGLAERVTALNNLAFLLAVQKNSGSQSLSLVEEAIERVGPMAELLDTRGMAYLAAGENDKALRDLQEATINDTSGLKHFHLALAYHRLKDLPAAEKALDESRRRGLRDNQLPPGERTMYQSLLRELGARAAIDR